MAPLEIRHRSVRPISAKHAQASRFLQQSPTASLRDEHLAGDHYIVVGEVKELSPVDWHRGEPLLFFKGGYRNLQRRDWWLHRKLVIDE
ncbi:flavin reductase family protein [Paenarthrobacter sp. SK]|uniref:flavin reductase family protein n=1 Tax=Paenarthrobacter sp. SK TaxID=3100179 RepID=UPI003392932F